MIPDFSVLSSTSQDGLRSRLACGALLPAWRVASLRAACVATLVALGACTPRYDWRDVRGTDAPYTVLLPAKPSIHTRSVNLGGIQASMTMTAAEVGDVTFAVGTAELPDADQAQAALLVMKDTLVKNIGGVVRHEKSTLGSQASTIELDAGPAAPGQPTGAAGKIAKPDAVTGGVPPARGRTTMALHARFLARGRRVYQVIVVGADKSVPQDAIDTFLTSFRLE